VRITQKLEGGKREKENKKMKEKEKARSEVSREFLLADNNNNKKKKMSIGKEGSIFINEKL
jgi:hypothetical protein